MRAFRLFAAACFILLGLCLPSAAQAGKRLILKDGSWQEIKKYEVQGDRTRYLSSQRWEWEEIPRDLVDWKATEEWNARSLQLPPEEAEERAKVDSTDPLTVAPGLLLPIDGGVYVLDTFSGAPSLVELMQEQGTLSHETSSLLHSTVNPRTPFKQRFELRGPHARTQLHVALPSIYVKVSPSEKGPQLAPTERFRIVRLEPGKESRVLASVGVSLTGKQSQSQQFVSARVTSFNEGWLKVVPMGELEGGEYALVEMLDANRFNAYAWDFGVDFHAPDNPNSRRANEKKETFSPELEPREK